MASRRTPSNAQAKRSPSTTGNNRATANTNTNNNNSSDYELLAKITKDPHYVARLRGVDAPPPPSSTSAFSAPFTRNDNMAVGGGAGGFSSRVGGGAPSSVGASGAVASAGMARLWDNHFTQERIPHYDAVNDRFCKFNLKKKAEDPTSGGNSGGGTLAGGSAPLRKTIGGRIGGGASGVGIGGFASSAVVGTTSASREGIASAGSVGGGHRLAPLSARTGAGAVGIGGGGRLVPDAPTHQNYMLPNNSSAYGSNNNNNNTINNMASATNSQQQRQMQMTSGATGGAATEDIDSLFQKSRYRLLALWEELGTPESDRAPLAPAMTLLPGQHPSIEAIRTITNEIQRLVDLRNSAVEVEKAIELREGFLYLLQELAERFSSQSGVGGSSAAERDKAYRELVALITPFRNASLQVVEAIGRWRNVNSFNSSQTNNVAAQLLAQNNANGAAPPATVAVSSSSTAAPPPPPYMWKGVSYLHKMHSDTYFLIHSRLGNLLEYEVRGNPLLDPRKIRLSADGTTPALPPVKVKNAVGGGQGVGGGGAATAAVPFARITKAEQVLAEEAQRQRLLRELGGDGQRHIPLSPAEEAELVRRRAEGEDERAIRIIRDEMKWSAHYNNNNSSNNNSSGKPASAGVGGGASRKALPYGSNSASSRNNGAFSKMSPIEIQNAAATDIQRVFKGHLARRYAEARREQVDSAIRIQRFVRRVLAKQEVVHRRMLVEAARKIQALQRGVSTRNRIARIRGAHASATLIQKVFRGYLTRKYTDMVRYLHVCATKIQATWRSYYVRQHVRGEIIYVRNQAATTIQAAWRGYYVRGIAKYNPLKVQKVVKLQAWFRGVLERRQVKEIMIRRYAATRIQAVYRMILAKRRCQAMRKMLEDASWEVYIGVATTAAIRIQSIWRMFMARQRVRDVREEWEKKNQQEHAKALLEEQMQTQSENATKHKAAIRIQSLVRGHLARKQVEMLRFLIASTITMQRVVRGFLGRLRAKEQRAILVSYMEQKGSIPEEKSRILPSTSYIKEALSILEMEVAATTTNTSNPQQRPADHDMDDQDQTIGNVSAVAAPADEEEPAGKHLPSSSNVTSPSKNGLETPVAESSGEPISSSAENDRASLKNEEKVQHTEEEDETESKLDGGADASSARHVDHVAADAHPLSIEMTHHTTNSAVEENSSSSPTAAEVGHVHETTPPLPKEEVPTIQEADKVEEKNTSPISETPELEPFVVVALSVSPQDFAAGHFRRSMARRVFSLSKVKEILDAHPFVSYSPTSGSDSGKVSATTTPTSSTPAGAKQQQHASRPAFVSANAGGEGHPSLSSLSTVNSFPLVTGHISGHSIEIFHVYQGSTHVCMRVKYFNSNNTAATDATCNNKRKGDNNAEENNHLDQEEQKAAANQRRLDASLLACLLEDYAANRSVYKDLMAIVDLRRGRADDLTKPAAEGVTIDDGVDLSLVHITSSTKGVSSSSLNSPVRRRVVASRRVEPIVSLPSEVETVVPEPKEEEEKKTATALPIVSSIDAVVAPQSQEDDDIVAERKHENNKADDSDGSPDADEEEEDIEDNVSEGETKSSPRPPTPPMKKKSVVTAEADLTTAENDFMDLDPADSALTNTIIERVLADAKKESGAHAEELSVAQVEEEKDISSDTASLPTTSAKIDDPQAAAEAARKIQRFFGTALGKKKAVVALEKKRGEVESRKAHTVHFADTQEVDHAASVIAALLVRAAVLNKKEKKQRVTCKLDHEAELEATAVSQEMNCASSMISRSLQVSVEYRKRLLQKGKRIAADAKVATRQEEEYEQMLLAQEAAEALSFAANANNDGQIQDEEEKEGMASFDAHVVFVGLEPGATTESYPSDGVLQNTTAASATVTATVTAAVMSVSEISLPSLGSPPENDKSDAKTPEITRPDAEAKCVEATSSREMQHEHDQQAPSEAPVSQLEATEASEAVELAPSDSEPTAAVADAFDFSTSPRPPSALEEIAELKRLMSAERRASAALATTEEPTTTEDHAVEEAIPEAAQVGTGVPTTVTSVSQEIAEQPSSSPRPPSALEEIAELKRLMSAERRASAAIASTEEVSRVASQAEEFKSETSEETKKDEKSLVVPSLVAEEEEASSSDAACDVSIRSPLGTARTAAAAATLVDDVINAIVDSHAVAPLTEAEEKEDHLAPSRSEPAETAEEVQSSSHSAAKVSSSPHEVDGQYTSDVASGSSSPDVPMESPVGVGVYVTASRPTSAIKALRSARGTAAAASFDDHHAGRLPIEDLVGNMGPVDSSLTSSVATTSISPRPRLANAGASEVPPIVPPTSSRPSSSRKASEQPSRPNSANEDAHRSSRASRAAAAAAALHKLEQQQEAIEGNESRKAENAEATMSSRRPPTLDEACRTVQAVLRYMHSSLIAAYWRDKVALAEFHTTRNFASIKIQQAFRCFEARRVVKERRAVQQRASEEKRVQAEVAAVESALAELRAMEEAEWQVAIRSQFNAKAVAIYESELAETKSYERLRAAALKIQCAWRCYNARFMFRWMRQQRLDKRREKAEHEAFIRGSEAALKIQCQVRKRQARQRADRIRSERDAARKAKADHEALLFTSALKIQCLFRCYNARYTVRFLREKKAQREALILEAKREEEQKILDAIRDREAKVIRDELERRSAVRIQCAWRCYNARFQRRWRQEAADKERAMNRARAIADAEASVKKAVEQDRMDRNLDLVSPTIYKPEIDSQPLL